MHRCNLAIRRTIKLRLNGILPDYQTMPQTTVYPRYIETLLAEALEDSPVVLIHGPRQCGKTTLAQTVCAPSQLKWGDDTFMWGDSPLSILSRHTRDY